MDGVDGMNGVDGTNGEDGTDGMNGEDGADGADGMNGTNGMDGTDGTDGMNGTNGMDGMDATPRPIGLSLSFVGRHSTGLFDAGGSEIVAYDTATHRVFAVNASTMTVDVIDVTDPAAHYVYVFPGQHGEFDLYSLGADNRDGGDGENQDVRSWE
jgi:hypothetical protein